MRRFGGLVLVLLFLVFPNYHLFAQTQQSGKTASLAEEQDYAFAYGLYADGLYQLATVQFD